MAITGSLAAAQLISSAPPRLALFLVDDIPGAAKELELREADAGANAILVKPFDEVLFARNRIVEEIVYAAPSQVVVDLTD